MHRVTIFLVAIVLLSVTAQAQVGMPGIEYAGTIAGGDGVQVYPYDQQDPWLHGYFQRYPAYGGFSSFRPYNYRHVFSQTQIAGGWGAAHGMPYSQQFWNKYRSSYLEGNLHSETRPQPLMMRPAQSIYPAGSVHPMVFETVSESVATPQPSVSHNGVVQQSSLSRPVHVYPKQ